MSISATQRKWLLLKCAEIGKGCVAAERKC